MATGYWRLVPVWYRRSLPKRSLLFAQHEDIDVRYNLRQYHHLADGAVERAVNLPNLLHRIEPTGFYQTNQRRTHGQAAGGGRQDEQDRRQITRDLVKTSIESPVLSGTEGLDPPMQATKVKIFVELTVDDPAKLIHYVKNAIGSVLAPDDSVLRLSHRQVRRQGGQVTMKKEEKLTRVQKKALKRLNYLWGHHDKVEREIIQLERHFTDAQLDSLLERGELA